MKSPQEGSRGRRRRSPNECRRIVLDYLASGESLWHFSQKAEISYGSLRKWVKRYGAQAKQDPAHSQSFVELPPAPMGSSAIAASVRMPSGAQITFHDGCDILLAKTLVKSLG